MNHRQQPAAYNSRATKRKRHPNAEQTDDNGINNNDNAERRQRLSVSNYKTLRPDPNSDLPLSIRFRPIRCSSSPSSSRRHNHRSNRTISEGSRKWVFSSRNFSNYEDKVLVVSYNILGVENTLKHPDLYLEVPPKFLEWDWRKKLICKEINQYSASIICFQEVDRFDDLGDLLQKDGFKGVYKARTGEAYDGCAIFWKDKLFTLLHQENIEFKSFGLRDNVAQLCVFKMNLDQSQPDLCTHIPETIPNQSRILLVGNIHVLFNPNRGDIKLGQVRLFLERAYNLSQEWGSIPVIMTGDLNSIPQSAMYQFLASSKLDVQLHDRRKISGQIQHPSQCRHFSSQARNAASISMSISRPLRYRWSDEELTLATGSGEITHLQHQLNLSSAYIGVPGNALTRDSNGEPLVTSYHSKFLGTVDYIWHTEELVPIRVLETLPVNILRSAGLPSKRWGSDHLALVCELAFSDDGNKT
ncbi:Exo_endo_phos domain-containing protein [Cephalotus follicularis]|uniref:Exo_endo_phos domain-containing protein n=1 Tax=Cephalotus follicularis TaxID=3775 RepID=A0A1Q3CQZ0_CEPFO|nr:Exo_endo_phos domain-containing protein [Cephalotus follicularis]